MVMDFIDYHHTVKGAGQSLMMGGGKKNAGQSGQDRKS
jgi:hypothetical protein